MNNKNSFNHNNWLKNNDNISLSVLDENGISIYLDKKGYINYRLSPNEPHNSTKDHKSLENIFKNEELNKGFESYLENDSKLFDYIDNLKSDLEDQKSEFNNYE